MAGLSVDLAPTHEDAWAGFGWVFPHAKQWCFVFDHWNQLTNGAMFGMFEHVQASSESSEDISFQRS